MSYRPPNNKTIAVYLAIGVLLLTVAFAVFGNVSGFRLLRILLIYGGAFLLLLFILRAARRR